MRFSVNEDGGLFFGSQTAAFAKISKNDLFDVFQKRSASFLEPHT